MKSILTKNQKKKISFKNINYQNEKVDLIITIRYDDECGNGHNTFSITGSLYKTGKRSDSALLCCGCIHDVIKELAPEYNKYIKWHLMSSNEPMHYISNTLYHSQTKISDLKAARSTAIAPNATLKQLQNKDWLKKRLPKLIKEFKKVVGELGFIY